MGVAIRARLLAPYIALALGWAWMWTASKYFQQETGREFYQLAGYHYTVPHDGFEYHEGGKTVELWTLTVPTVTTLSVIGFLLVAFLVAFWREGPVVLAGGAILHAGAALVFLLVHAWFGLNVLGVFI